MAQKRLGSIIVDNAALQKALKGKAEGANYYGANDNMLDFRSASSFIDEDNCGKRFQFTVKNTSDAAVKVNLNPAVVVADYQDLKEGEVATGVTAAGSPRSIQTLLAYVAKNPTRIQAIKMKVDDASQLDEPLVLRHETPWASYTEEQRIPSDFQDQNTNRENIADINDIQGWLLSSEDTMLLTVGAGRTVNISITFGASLDTAQALSKKASEAAENVAIAYAHRSK